MRGELANTHVHASLLVVRYMSAAWLQRTIPQRHQAISKVSRRYLPKGPHETKMFGLNRGSTTLLQEACQDELSADTGYDSPIVSGGQRSCALRKMGWPPYGKRFLSPQPYAERLRRTRYDFRSRRNGGDRGPMVPTQRRIAGKRGPSGVSPWRPLRSVTVVPLVRLRR